MVKIMSDKGPVFVLLVAVIVIIFLGFFVVRPAIVGYSAYNKIEESDYSFEEYGENVRELESRLLVLEADLSSCQNFNEKFLQELEDYSKTLAECKKELGGLYANLNSSREKYEKEINELNEELDKIKDEIEQIEDDYNELAQKTADNLCCKAKVDNSNIKYYEIVNNKVVCLEDGILEISCG